TSTEEQDIVVVTVRLLTGPDAGERDLYESSLFTDYEQRLFTQVVAIAEKHGKPVELLVVPSNDVFDAVVQTAVKLDSAEIVSGPSAKMSVQDQARYLGRAWERLSETPRRQVTFTILDTESKESHVLLGAHAPNLTKDDIDLIHRIWIQVSKIPSRRRVHHRDVVRVALNRLERDLKTQGDVMLDFYKLEHEGNGHDKNRGKSAGPPGK
ncbi:MAG: APC family permease, partial [Blastocatellia bacterium]